MAIVPRNGVREGSDVDIDNPVLLETPLPADRDRVHRRTPGSDGTLLAISPCLANLFLHYGFDASWMVREFPTIQFERFRTMR
jgi:hypothetical protein